MEYETEELVPIVAKLAEGYTSKESTSITYEKAQQLMEAVLYCIHEGERAEVFSIAQKDELSPKRIYEIGVKYVEEKTKETLKLYNGIMTHFSSYGNKCLYDTVVKGLPEFFKWYDCKYDPQNTILTLDYPVLVDVTEHTGIDKIYDFIVCIQLEQKFLNRFPTEYVMKILSKYDRDYKLIIDNICEIVLMNVLGHFLTEEIIQMENLENLRSGFKNNIEKMVRKYYENDEKLKEYLYKAVDNISVRIKNAADNGNLHCIL
ncbi:MAG: DUF6179 domain-containing protein [Butyrivibrio sp.]